MFIETERIFTKHAIIPGGRLGGQKDITLEQANSSGMPPDQKVNKAEELTYLSTNIGWTVGI
jgi:hypothetical protein